MLTESSCALDPSLFLFVKAERFTGAGFCFLWQPFACLAS